jgi:hypothetical protein
MGDMRILPSLPARIILPVIFLAACSGTDVSVNAPGGGLPLTYNSPDSSFSVRRPDGWDMKEKYHLVTDAYEADGVALMAPADRTKTTLYEGIFHVATPAQCPELEGADTVEVKGRTYLHDNWNGAAAGNRYEGESYTTETDSGCLVVTFYAHSCNLSPEECGPTSPQPYDRSALFAIMRQMLETLRLTP